MSMTNVTVMTGCKSNTEIGDGRDSTRTLYISRPSDLDSRPDYDYDSVHDYVEKTTFTPLCAYGDLESYCDR